MQSYSVQRGSHMSTIEPSFLPAPRTSKVSVDFGERNLSRARTLFTAGRLSRGHTTSCFDARSRACITRSFILETSCQVSLVIGVLPAHIQS